MNNDKVWNKNTSANILVVDDDRQIADMLKDYLVSRGYATTDSAVEAINQGAYDFIAKPFEWEQLEVVLRRAIERYRSMKQLGVYRGVVWLAALPVLILIGQLMFRFF